MKKIAAIIAFVLVVFFTGVRILHSVYEYELSQVKQGNELRKPSPAIHQPSREDDKCQLNNPCVKRLTNVI